MVVIRLSRGGCKQRPFYQIIVTDKRNRRDGRYIERLGYFNPLARGKEVALSVDLARVDHWCDQGAQLSDRVAQLVGTQRKANAATVTEKATEAKPGKAAATKVAAADTKPAEKPASAAKTTAPAKKSAARKSAAPAKKAATATEKPATKKAATTAKKASSSKPKAPAKKAAAKPKSSEATEKDKA